MVKHIILWTLKEMSDSEKESVKAGIRSSCRQQSKMRYLVNTKFLQV